MKTATKLKLVEPSSEKVLRDLFRQEDDLIDQLARCVSAQKEVRQRYAKERGLLILPGLETLRKVLGV